MPAILHIDPVTFAAYPPLLKAKMLGLLYRYIGAGQLDLMSIQRPEHA